MLFFVLFMKSLSDNTQADISAVNLTSAHVEDRIYISNPYFEGIAKRISCLSHTRLRDHPIARLVTNLGYVRLVTTTKDQPLGFIYDLSLMLFEKCIL